MKVFLTGATGFIGSRIIPQLLDAGHTVLGLTRSEEGVKHLEALGAEPHRGNIEDLESLRAGAAASDGVIHCGFNHDFSRFLQSTQDDIAAIRALGEPLIGTGKPLLITSGVGMGISEAGKPGTEDFFDANNPNPRKASEMTGEVMKSEGVNTVVIRLPQVHDPKKQGLITPYIAMVREHGYAAYVGAGESVWSAAPVSDVARLYRLALEKALHTPQPGVRYNAVAEEAVSMRAIAETIARVLKVPAKSITPEEAQAYFGWMAMFADHSMTGDSTWTRERLGWTPTGPGLLEDLAKGEF